MSIELQWLFIMFGVSLLVGLGVLYCSRKNGYTLMGRIKQLTLCVTAGLFLALIGIALDGHYLG